MSYVDAAINRLKDEAERKMTTPPTPDAGVLTCWLCTQPIGDDVKSATTADAQPMHRYMNDCINAQRDHIATLTAQLAAANALMPLSRLGAWTLEHIRGDCAGDVDAFAVQDEAVRLGVIACVPAPKPCGTCCLCEEGDADFCFRDTDATAKARAALRAQEGA